MKNKHPLFDAYVEACSYPGNLNVQAAELALSEYVAALGIERKIVRLERGWRVEQHPSLLKTMREIAADICKRTSSLDALAAQRSEEQTSELQSQ